MKPIERLTNVDRARLMHQLLPAEMPALLRSIDEISKVVIDQADDIRAFWSNPMIHPEAWIRLAKVIQQEITSCSGNFRTSKSFAERLFDGYLGLFAAHCVCQHAEQTDNSKFKAVATLFFGYDPDEE